MSLEKRLYPQVAWGVASGVYNYYVKPEITAKRAWMALGAAVAAYEAIAPTGELLSEGVDKALLKYPLTTRLAIGVTALHLANVLPPSIDPFHQLIKWRQP